jgi:hypothetical protein
MPAAVVVQQLVLAYSSCLSLLAAVLAAAAVGRLLRQVWLVGSGRGSGGAGRRYATCFVMR